MAKFQVDGEKVTPEGEIVGGDGGKYEADSADDAVQQFRDTHFEGIPGVWEWRISANLLGEQ